MTAAPTPIRECDAALDYLYGMLEGDAKVRFEAHLPGCPRCQEELVAFGKVRTIAKAALEPVEPTERLTGPLHAQLLHAAAQRKPRGQVVPFMRRVFRHPAYAAAAGLLLIGGAVGVQWSRGKLVPLPSHAAQPVSEPAVGANLDAKVVHDKEMTPQAAPVVPTVTAADAVEKKIVATKAELKPAPAFKSVDTRGEGGLRGIVKTPSSGKGGGDGYRDDDLSGQGSLDKLSRAPDSTTATGGSLGASGQGSPQRSANYFGTKDSSGSSTRSQPPAYGGQDDGAPRAAEAAKKHNVGTAAATTPPSAPTTERPRMAKAEPEPAPAHVAHHAAANDSPDESSRDREAPPERRPLESNRMGRADSPAATSAAPVKPSQMTPPGGVEEQALNDTVKSDHDHKSSADPQTVAVPSPADANVDATDAERSRGAALVQAGRCDEAVTLYRAIERRAPTRLTAQDRLGFERCLRVLGRLTPAQSQIDQLRANRAKNALPAAALEAEQKAIDVDRKRQTTTRLRAAKAKRAAPTSVDLDDAQEKAGDAGPVKSNAPNSGK